MRDADRQPRYACGGAGRTGRVRKTDASTADDHHSCRVRPLHRRVVSRDALVFLGLDDGRLRRPWLSDAPVQLLEDNVSHRIHHRADVRAGPQAVPHHHCGR